jgi:YVTN family beta-propeller protein
MKHGATKTLKVGCILLVIFFLLCAFALLPQSVQASNTVTATITGGFSEPTAVAVTPNGAYAYVTNSGPGVGNPVSVINTAKNTVTANVSVSTPAASYPIGVAITPNGDYAYVTSTSIYGGTVSIINTATNKVKATIDVGANPYGVAVTPNGAYV